METFHLDRFKGCYFRVQEGLGLLPEDFVKGKDVLELTDSITTALKKQENYRVLQHLDAIMISRKWLLALGFTSSGGKWKKDSLSLLTYPGHYMLNDSRGNSVPVSSIHEIQEFCNRFNHPQPKGVPDYE